MGWVAVECNSIEEAIEKAEACRSSGCLADEFIFSSMLIAKIQQAERELSQNLVKAGYKDKSGLLSVLVGFATLNYWLVFYAKHRHDFEEMGLQSNPRLAIIRPYRDFCTSISDNHNWNGNIHVDEIGRAHFMRKRYYENPGCGHG